MQVRAFERHIPLMKVKNIVFRPHFGIERRFHGRIKIYLPRLKCYVYLQSFFGHKYNLPSKLKVLI